MAEWSELDLERNARVVRDGERIVGYGAVHDEGELWRAEGFVHPDARGRGIGKLIATGLEELAARRGARRIQNDHFEPDSGATRRPRRRQGVGAALLGDAFARFWERGEHSIGLGVDAASGTGAFRLYERAGMAAVLGWVVHEKALADG